MTTPTSKLRTVRRRIDRLVRRLKCFMGFHCWCYDTVDRNRNRFCPACWRLETYTLVDFGRTKEWMPRQKPPNTQPSGCNTP